MFECRRFATHRQLLEDVMGTPITIANLVPGMLEAPRKWNAVSSFAATVMRELRQAELAHLAGVPDITTSEPTSTPSSVAGATTTMEEELAAFRKVPRLQRTPPSMDQAPLSAPPILQPVIFTFSGKEASEEDSTPKRTRSVMSPTNQT
ncbi:hypothetical protein ACLKA6_005683 [Drosophila palustris]